MAGTPAMPPGGAGLASISHTVGVVSALQATVSKPTYSPNIECRRNEPVDRSMNPPNLIESMSGTDLFFFQILLTREANRCPATQR
jgi:hypothetical protein